MSNKATAIEFLQMAARGDVDDAYARHVAAAFEHHNPHFPEGRQALLDAMRHSASAEPNESFQIIRAIEEADTVAVHSRLARRDTDACYAVVHILRFEGGKIVEMWDVVQEAPATSPNALGMF